MQNQYTEGPGMTLDELVWELRNSTWELGLWRQENFHWKVMPYMIDRSHRFVLWTGVSPRVR